MSDHLDRAIAALAKARNQTLTGRARLTLRYAEQEAEQRNHPAVAPEHLLLAITRDPNSVAALALQSLDVSLEWLQRTVDELLLSGRWDEIPPEARIEATIACAFDEATALGHAHTGTEHLLLGLLHGGSNGAAALLIERGVDLQHARSAVLMALDDWHHKPSGGAPLCAAPV